MSLCRKLNNNDQSILRARVVLLLTLPSEKDLGLPDASITAEAVVSPHQENAVLELRYNVACRKLSLLFRTHRARL